MRSKFDEELRQLNAEMTIMGDMIEDAIRSAFMAFLRQDAATAKRIADSDEKVDAQQKKIEHICFELLIQQQPVARDLRAITAALKMVTDMERIGDHAQDISELTEIMAGTPYTIQTTRLRKMTEETMNMLSNAVEAYVTKDADKARDVIAHDDIVDRLFADVKRYLIEIMGTMPQIAEEAADLLMIDKYLERIGDHATNIAEWVIFSIEGNPEITGD